MPAFNHSENTLLKCKGFAFKCLSLYETHLIDIGWCSFGQEEFIFEFDDDFVAAFLLVGFIREGEVAAIERDLFGA